MSTEYWMSYWPRVLETPESGTANRGKLLEYNTYGSLDHPDTGEVTEIPNTSFICSSLFASLTSTLSESNNLMTIL